MKMLALVGEAYGGHGGIGRYNVDLFGALASLGRFQVRILPRHGARGAATPAGIEQAAAVPGRTPYLLRSIAAALDYRPDVIFCGHLFMAWLAALLARMTGAKLLVQLHGIEGWRAPSRLNRQAVERADLVLCVSRDTRARLMGWSALPPDRAVVVPNTVHEDFTPGDRDAARRRFGLDGQKVLLSVGRLDRREQYKGQDRVIRALPGLAAAGLDALYLVAGDGDDRGRLEALARECGVAERVRFLGKVDDADLPDLYRAADLFVLPSTGEGFGIVFLEAMACGTPAVGLAAGGAVDALGDGELGAAVSEAELGATLERLLNAPRRPELAAEVQRRYGRPAFQRRVAAAMSRLTSKTAA